VEVLVGSYLHYLNGLAIDPSGSWLYLAQTTASNILRFPISGIGLGEPEIYATIPGTAPDGLALAESGNLYVGCYTPDAIYVVEPGGRVEPVVVVHGRISSTARPILAFGDGVLYYANLGGYHIGMLPVSDVGAPLHRPTFPA